jgi:alpha-D-xyloside xylohydrolase
MPYRPPLVPYEVFVADPVDLPVRRPGDSGPSGLARAEVVSSDTRGVSLKAATTDGQVLAAELCVAGEGVVRVRLSEDPDARTRSAAVITMVHPGSDPNARIQVGADTVRVETGPLVAELTLDPWRLRFLRSDGQELIVENPGEIDISGRVRTLPFGRSTADGEVVAYHVCFDAGADEHFVGFGEKFTGFDKRGQRAVMWNYDAFGAESDRAYKNVPFYLSSRGYGLLVDSGMATEFDMCQSTHSCVQIVVPDNLIDYYVLAGPTPTDVLRRFDALTGTPSLPPKWAFGSWISSGFFVDTAEAVRDRARRIRADGIPCDVLHLDTYWQTEDHWSELEWDSERFPDPDGLLAHVAEQGFKVCLWINPYLSHLSPRFAEIEALGYFLRRPDGSTYVADVWHGSYPASGILDFTNPDATAWFQEKLRALLRAGVAVFKTDFAEGVPADAVSAAGLTGIELHNVYSLLYNDAVAEATRQVRGHDMVWARSSFLGGQRHCAQWSGDSNASYAAMASTLRGGLTHGLSGVPFWSHDAGGFNGTPTPDLYVRWAQFGAFSPLMRLHGTTSREPWHFPPGAAAAATEAIRLRYRLMPYLYTAAVEAARTGAPMMRALLVDSADDPGAWLADLEYLVGPDLLVAPMTNPNSERHVYLPAGRWIDWWTGSILEGGGYRRVAKPLDQIPLFVREGALIAATPIRDTIGDDPFPEVTLLSFGATSAQATMFDVDGDTRISAVRSSDVFAVTLDGPARVTRIDFPVIDGGRVPTCVTINGRPTVLSHGADGVLTALVGP